ncbi:MAG: PIN domain-containing protein [Solirubrobacterales bacterium]
MREELDQLALDFQGLLDASTIRNVDPNRGRPSGVAFLGFAKFGWGASDETQDQLRQELLRRYERWLERFRLLFRDATQDVAKDLEGVDGFVRRWIERESNDHSVPSTIEAAKARAEEEFRTFARLLDLAARPGNDGVIAVPDTSSLIDAPNLADYGPGLGLPAVEVVIVPTVLAELDELKSVGRRPELRDAAQGVVRRLKGLRDRGRLADGVQVARGITVSARSREPTMHQTLPWLDGEVNDDRILATALELQSERPAACVLLVTADLNLQNKADAVGLPYAEPPDAA